MPRSPRILDSNQQELVNIVKLAHTNLAAARNLKSQELDRRIAEAKIKHERALDEEVARIRLDLEAEITQHASILDEAVIAAFEGNVPVRQIALEGFGNRYDGGVQQVLRELRKDGRVGNAVGYQRNTTEGGGFSVEFPKPLDLDTINRATEVQPPAFEGLASVLTLVEPDANGDGGVYAPAVALHMDPRDEWFKSIERNARPGTPFLKATSCTLYIHPFTNDLMVLESEEPGELTWDHPVARWVKTHPEKARAGFDAALAEPVTKEQLEQIADLGDQLGIDTDVQ